jgi:23S rRNA pseudouridine2605 synthase
MLDLAQASPQQEGSPLSSPMIPTADQLSQARLAQAHQNGEALLTFENLRSWLNVAGLVLYTPRPQQLPAPAPSFVEAVLGAPTPEPTLADTEQARSLLGRLIAEGIAVPLNLLGTPGETPDFIVSAPVFSYIFTLRGDKAWKQPPVTSGAFKVSPLAAAACEALGRRPMLSAYDLATELGKEVTESAVLRALNELWAHLRVLPIAQADGAPTLWELSGARFTKQIKAGANAGQPSALSALISLYLGSSLLASEEEIETFLSPLAPRSRIRDVVHALMGARELETLAVEGRTLLHVSGSLPAFLASPAAEEDADDAKPVETIEVEDAATLEATDAPRISKFVPKPRKVGTGFPSDYGRKFNGKPLEDRDRRPFARGAKPAYAAKPDRAARPTFNKPWEEERAKPLPAATAGEGDAASPSAFTPRPAADRGDFAARPARSYGAKPRFDRAAGGAGGSDRRDGTRPAFGRKPAFGARPSFGGSREGFAGKREGFTPRPSFRRDDDSRPPRREFPPRSGGDSSAPRKTFSKPGTFGRKREGFAGKPSGGFAPRTPGSYSPRPQGGEGGARGDWKVRGDQNARPDRGFAPRKPFTPRGEGSSRGGSADRGPRPPFRKFDAPRAPREGGDRPARPYSPRKSFGEGAVGSGRSDRGQDRDERPARPYGDRPARPYGKSAEGGFGAKKPFSKAGKPSGFAGKAANTFTKFADGKNPFRKPGKPGGKAGSFKGKPTGGFDKPMYRKRKPGAGE